MFVLRSGEVLSVKFTRTHKARGRSAGETVERKWLERETVRAHPAMARGGVGVDVRLSPTTVSNRR